MFEKEKINLFNVYVQPTTLKNELMVLSEIDCSNSIICGDFNSHNNVWSNGGPNGRGVFMKKWMEMNNMEVINNTKQATYIVPNKTKTTPDLIIISKNIKNNVIKSNVGPYTGSDHLPLLMEIKIDKGMLAKQKKKIIYDLKTLDIESFKKEIEFQAKRLFRVRFNVNNGEINAENLNNIIKSSWEFF